MRVERPSTARSPVTPHTTINTKRSIESKDIKPIQKQKELHQRASHKQAETDRVWPTNHVDDEPIKIRIQYERRICYRAIIEVIRVVADTVRFA